MDRGGFEGGESVARPMLVNLFSDVQSEISFGWRELPPIPIQTMHGTVAISRKIGKLLHLDKNLSLRLRKKIEFFVLKVSDIG